MKSPNFSSRVLSVDVVEFPTNLDVAKLSGDAERNVEYSCSLNMSVSLLVAQKCLPTFLPAKVSVIVCTCIIWTLHHKLLSHHRLTFFYKQHSILDQHSICTILNSYRIAKAIIVTKSSHQKVYYHSKVFKICHVNETNAKPLLFLHTVPDFGSCHSLAVFTLETDYLSETGYLLDNSHQTDNRS